MHVKSKSVCKIGGLETRRHHADHPGVVALQMRDDVVWIRAGPAECQSKAESPRECLNLFDILVACIRVNRSIDHADCMRNLGLSGHEMALPREREEHQGDRSPGGALPDEKSLSHGAARCSLSDADRGF